MSPVRTSLDRSRAEVMSPVRTSFDSDMRRAEVMKSPVEKALDKLLGEYIISFFSKANVTFFIQRTIPL